MKKLVLILSVAFAFALLAVPVFAGGQKEATSGGTVTVWHYFSVDSQVQELKDLAALYNQTSPNVQVNYVFVPYDQLPNKVVAASAASTGPGRGGLQRTERRAVRGCKGHHRPFPLLELVRGQGPLRPCRRSLHWWKGLRGPGIRQPAGPLVQQGHPGQARNHAARHDRRPDGRAAESDAGRLQGHHPHGEAQRPGEWQSYPWMSAYGWNYSNPDANAAQQAFSLVSSWASKGYLSRIVVTWEQTEPFQAFTVGDVAFTENGNWQLGTAKANAHFNYGVVAMPAGPNPAKVYLGGEAESIGAFSKNPKLAWQYLQGSYFSKAGQLIAFRDVGSIPSRKDAAEDPAVTADKLLAPFAQEVQTVGALYPPDAGPVTKVQNAQLVVGQQWSAVIAGQEDPAAAAQKAVSGVQTELAK